MPAPHVVVIVGPTASGKSNLAIEVAEAVNGEIIGADSRQVYRYLDIGTAKPTTNDRSRVRHHLIDIVDPDEDYSLALYVRQARETIDSILARDSVPIVVGGTGQYVWGLLEGWDVPNVPPNESLRASLQERLEYKGLKVLVEELGVIAPIAAARVDLKNPRRVIRALELAHQNDDEEVASPSRTPPPFDFTIIGQTLERSDLYARINSRTDAMFKAGWVGEVERLVGMGYGRELPSMSSLGYREISEFLKSERTLEDAIDAIKQKTRRFARQQYAWFRLGDERIQWFKSNRDSFNAAVEYARSRMGSR